MIQSILLDDVNILSSHLYKVLDRLSYNEENTLSPIDPKNLELFVISNSFDMPVEHISGLYVLAAASSIS